MIFEHVFGMPRHKNDEKPDGKEIIAQELLGALKEAYPGETSFTREDAERVYAHSHDIPLTDLKEHHKVIVGHALSTLAHSSHANLFFTGEVYWLTPNPETRH
ncbi:MAG: hypothetical protein WAX57_03575 [Minisyncoccia bacterium]